MQLDAKTTGLIVIDLQRGVVVVAEDLCSALDADMHTFSFRHILPRLARVTSSEVVTLR